MTNKQIIFNASMELMKNGIIQGTGEFTEVFTADENGQNKKEIIEIPEPIHTFQNWKTLGRSVKKGEKAKASFSIWKYTKKKSKDADGNEEEKENMFLKKSFFFTYDQTEPTKEKSGKA